MKSPRFEESNRLLPGNSKPNLFQKSKEHNYNDQTFGESGFPKFASVEEVNLQKDQERDEFTKIVDCNGTKSITERASLNRDTQGLFINSKINESFEKKKKKSTQRSIS